MIDRGQGRGVVCFDADRDGDIDIFVANNSQSHEYYRNDLEPRGNFLQVRLRGEGMNREAVGARIYVTTGSLTQMHELRSGSNYVSQQPCEAHFGLGTATTVDRLTVVWPDGEVDLFHDIPSNRFLFLEKEKNHPRSLLRRSWDRRP